MKTILNWYYGKASIRKKLVISYVFLVLLPILVLGIYSHDIAKKNLMEQTKNTLQNNISSIKYGLESNIQRENDNIEYLSYNKEFRENLESAKGSMTELAQVMNKSVEPTFWYFITSDNNIKEIEIYSPYIERAMGSFLKPIDSPEKEKWYHFYSSNFKPCWTYEDEKIYATRTLLDANTSAKPIGIMKLEVYPRRLLDPIYQYRYLNNGIAILDAKQQIIKEEPIGNKRLQSKIHDRILSSPGINYTETTQYILYQAEIADIGWTVYYYIDKNEISGPLIQILEKTLLIVSICFAFIVILISIMSKILSSRILELKTYAEKVSEGKFDLVINTRYTDEIGVVAQSFSEMSRKLNDMINQVFKMELEKRATELKALQAMINPHFLFNCLSSIKWKAIKAEQDEISDITGLLAKFYRTTLNDGKQITTIRNELDNVKSYLELQRKTHENNFDVIYELSEENQELQMPNFLLQPIVENAICHGVDNCDAATRGLIKIQFYVTEDFLIFNIYNNGSQLEDVQLKAILNTPGNGYGLYNIQERIRLYYDASCGVSASIEKHGLVCFMVKLRKMIQS